LRGTYSALVARLASRRYDAGHADVAQLVERVHGKDEVKGSSPFVGSRFCTGTSPGFGTIFVRVCPRLSIGPAGETQDQESNMALYLAVARPSRFLMVSRRSRVRAPTSAWIFSLCNAKIDCSRHNSKLAQDQLV
jgi:hypothetical protein